MKKVGRNSMCPCGSGKKYKKCCFDKNSSSMDFKDQNDFNKWVENVSKLPLTTYISSKNGESASMQVGNASIIRDGVETKLFEDPIVLSTNSIDGDKMPSSATLTIPTQGNEKPKISIKGNASVINETDHYAIKPLTGGKMKISTQDGIKVEIDIKNQRDEEFHYFDVLFLTGERHPHITLYPDGNGKFIEQRGFDCKLENILDYNPTQKTISPSKISISVKGISEKLIMDFNFDNSTKIVELTKANFV